MSRAGGGRRRRRAGEGLRPDSALPPQDPDPLPASGALAGGQAGDGADLPVRAGNKALRSPRLRLFLGAAPGGEVAEARRLPAGPCPGAGRCRGCPAVPRPRKGPGPGWGGSPSLGDSPGPPGVAAGAGPRGRASPEKGGREEASAYLGSRLPEPREGWGTGGPGPVHPVTAGRGLKRRRGFPGVERPIAPGCPRAEAGGGPGARRGKGGSDAPLQVWPGPPPRGGARVSPQPLPSPAGPAASELPSRLFCSSFLGQLGITAKKRGPWLVSSGEKGVCVCVSVWILFDKSISFIMGFSHQKSL